MAAEANVSITQRKTISQDDATDLLLITIERTAIGNGAIGAPGSTEGIPFITARSMVARADKREVVRQSLVTELWLTTPGYGTTVLYLHPDGEANLDAWRAERAASAAKGHALLEQLSRDAAAEDDFPF